MKNKPNMQTVGDSIDYYLEYVAPNRLKDSTYTVARSTLKQWRAAIGDVKLSNLSPNDLLMVRDAIHNPATANRMMSVLSSALRPAIERGMLASNPCTNIQPMRVRNSDTGKVITNDHWQVIRHYAVSSAPYEFVTLITLLRETGCRIGEVMRLTPNDITHGETPTLVFLDTKSNVDRVIPISTRLAQFLASSPLPGSHYRNHWRRAIEPTGVHYRYHDIRHTFITEKLAQGVNPWLLGAYVGHASVSTSKRYFHPDMAQLRKNIIDA